jgi:hypothetical protein
VLSRACWRPVLLASFLVLYYFSFCFHPLPEPIFAGEPFILGPETESAAESNMMTTMEVILRAIRTRNVGDSRDRVFAFYGVLKALGVAPTKPDYRNSAGRVYQDFFVDLLKSREPESLVGCWISWIPRHSVLVPTLGRSQ